MGVDAKLIVVCKEEEKMKVMEKILLSVGELVTVSRSLSRFDVNSWSYKETLTTGDGVYSSTAAMSTHNFRTFTIKFGIGDKYERQAFVHTTCERDVEDILGTYKEPHAAVLFSVGCWGQSELILNFVAQELCKSYDVYVDYNDSDDVDYVKFQGEM